MFLLTPRSLASLISGLVVLCLNAGSASAQLRTGHSIPGFLGLELGSAPAPGLHLENMTLLYSADVQANRNGDDVGVNSLSALSNQSTLSWSTPWNILGARFVKRAGLPLATTEMNPHTTELGTGSLGLGDIYLQPLSLYWEGERHRVNFGYAYWMDTGSYSASADDNTGKGFDTHEFSLGMTYYPKRWSEWHMSAMTRFEFHGNVDGLDLDPGGDIVLDWSVGKRTSERWNVGLAGYGVWQTSRDSGLDANGNDGFYGTAGVGGEARYSMPQWNGDLVMRGFYEFNAFNRPEGLALFLGLSYGF